jgi:hypothetical protein
MHKLNVVHGGLKIVCPFLHLHCDHALMFVQTNILVDPDGRARVAGLGAACVSPLMPEADIGRSFEPRDATPELVQRYGLTNARATKDSDVRAFGALAFEVGPMVTVSWASYSMERLFS